MAPSPSDRGPASPLTNRWLQLAAGLVCMVMISSLQHGWTPFVQPIDDKYDWGRTAIQVAFTMFIVTETFLVPVEGWFVDRFGPRPVVLLGGLLVAVSLDLNSIANSLPLLYGGAALLIPLAEPMVTATGSWQTVFVRPMRAARVKSVAIAE
jgi:OFA family oxalate/formate antiporter-like MFS transporter